MNLTLNTYDAHGHLFRTSVRSPQYAPVADVARLLMDAPLCASCGPEQQAPHGTCRHRRHELVLPSELVAGLKADISPSRLGLVSFTPSGDLLFRGIPVKVSSAVGRMDVV